MHNICSRKMGIHVAILLSYNFYCIDQKVVHRKINKHCKPLAPYSTQN